MTDEYYDIDFRQKHPTVKGYWVQADKFNEMYRKATALDKIRADIEKVFCMSVVTNELRTPMEVKSEILQILDKYR